MLKIILVCNNGMSTAMMAKKMNEKSDGYCYVEAYGDGDFMNYLEGCDLILVGPQIRQEIPRIKKFVDASVPVVSMNPSHYGLMNAKGVIDDVKKIMKERKDVYKRQGKSSTGNQAGHGICEADGSTVMRGCRLWEDRGCSPCGI